MASKVCSSCPKKTIHKDTLSTVTIDFNDSEVTTLYNFLHKHKDEYPDLHEKVYQAMTKTLMARINS